MGESGMSAVPNDIRETAKAVRANLCNDIVCVLDRGCGCLDAIAEALMAERERCAKIADMWGPEEEYTHGDHYASGLCDAGERIAAAIRSDNAAGKP